MDSTRRGERVLRLFWVLLLGGRLSSAVPPHGLVDSIGERRGAEAQLGLSAGRVDDERFVKLVAHLVDFAHRPVDEPERAHLPRWHDLQPRPGAGGLVYERDDVARCARLGARQMPDTSERLVPLAEADEVLAD